MRDRRGGMTLELSVTIGVLVILIALLAPAVQSSREKARRQRSRNNLKQWGLAVHNYVDIFGRMPPGGLVLQDQTERHGWVTALLPYLEASPLYSSIDLNRSWHDPRNQPACRVVVHAAVYPDLSPTQTAEGYGLVHYAANSQVMHRNSSVRLDQITAGLSNTLLLGEAAGEFRPWGCPWNWRVVAGPLNGGPGGYGHDGRGETDFVLMDGEVKAFNNDVDPVVLEQLASGGLLTRPEDVARPPIPAGYPMTEVRHQYTWPRKGDAWIPPADAR